MAFTIKEVDKGSPAMKAGIRSGDRIVSINGNEIKDVLDYRFYMTDSRLDIRVLDSKGNERNVTVNKDEYDDLGLEFETYLMDEEHCCKNKCIFCFIDQMPPHMRETLYFKDDDSRLGFLFGNYITMTNLDDGDLDRIIKMHLSPINVSVHTTNPELRVSMMKNPKAACIMDQLRKLADAGIAIHAQIVLCPGINDGAELIRTFNDLSGLGNAVESAVCVPVGLTKCREGLPVLEPYCKETAAEVIKTVDMFRERMSAERGDPLFYSADEFYIKSEIPLPDYDYYGDFTQLEDGVGLCALLKHDFIESLDMFEAKHYERRITIPTGKAAYGVIRELCDIAEERFPGVRVNVIPIENVFFGEKITVTGLITGGDIISQLKDRPEDDEVLICESMLRYENDRFIDDVTTDEIEEKLGKPVTFVPNDGYRLLAAILGEDTEECEVSYC